MDKDFLYSVGIFVTFSLGVWNVFNNRRTTYINTITSERIKWLEQLRQDISRFVGLTHTWHMSELGPKSDVLKEIDKLRYLIRLRLNPDPKANLERDIEKLLKEIPELTDISRRDELLKALDTLTETSQLLFKNVWEKIKKEAGEDKKHTIGK